MKRVTAADAKHEPMVYTAWGRFCIFFDPEGNPLQFYESAFVRPDEDPDRING